MNYSIEYFIEKFEKIPDENFYINCLETFMLDFNIFSFRVEDYVSMKLMRGFWDFEKIAPTPKQRIILALEVERDLRDWRKK